jgi:hypothetical protein
VISECLEVERLLGNKALPCSRADSDIMCHSRSYQMFAQLLPLRGNWWGNVSTSQAVHAHHGGLSSNDTGPVGVYREIVINCSPRGGAIGLSTLPYRLYLIFISFATPLTQVEGSGAHSPRIWENNTMCIILAAHKQYTTVALIVFARVPWTCAS